jgi:hypothetical protein
MKSYKPWQSYHTVWDWKYHRAWVTKYRDLVLVGGVGQRCRVLLREFAALGKGYWGQRLWVSGLRAAATCLMLYGPNISRTGHRRSRTITSMWYECAEGGPIQLNP